MEKGNNLAIQIAWILAVGGILLIFLGAFAKLESWNISSELLLTAIIICGLGWLLILVDIVGHRIEHKLFWILSMILLPGIAPIVYLIQRRKVVNQHIG